MSPLIERLNNLNQKQRDVDAKIQSLEKRSKESAVITTKWIADFRAKMKDDKQFLAKLDAKRARTKAGLAKIHEVTSVENVRTKSDPARDARNQQHSKWLADTRKSFERLGIESRKIAASLTPQEIKKIQVARKTVAGLETAIARHNADESHETRKFVEFVHACAGILNMSQDSSST